MMMKFYGVEVFFMAVKNFSSIQLSVETKQKLKALALTENESYENIICRLLEKEIGILPREIKYNIRSKDYPFGVDFVVDWESPVANLTFLDGDGERFNHVPIGNLPYVDDYPDEWVLFREWVDGLDNLLEWVSILESGAEVDVVRGVLKRY